MDMPQRHGHHARHKHNSLSSNGYTAHDTKEGIMTASTATANRGRLVGEHHADTAKLSADDIAARLFKDLGDIRGDGMLLADAEFSVTADAAAQVPVLRVTVTCNTDAGDAIAGMAAHLAGQVFGLASHYNEVDLDQPSQVRFLQHVQVKCGDAAIATLVGAMVQTA